MPRMELKFSEMEGAVFQARQAADRFISAAQALLDCSRMLEDAWEGDSSAAFQEARQQAASLLTAMIGLADGYARQLQEKSRWAQPDALAHAAIRNH